MIQSNGNREEGRAGGPLPSNCPRWAATLEVAILFLAFLAYAGQIPPDVNESHYLTKAKHFWDPTYCPGDIFLASEATHWLFYLATAWVTPFVSLSVYAWLGRIATWLLLACAWQRLSFATLPVAGASILSGSLLLLLVDRGHLAGEWIVGGLEGKGFAYALVLTALAEAQRGRWIFAWPALGLAAGFHLLVGFWGAAALGITGGYGLLEQLLHAPSRGAIRLVVERGRQMAVPMLVGLGLALVGLLPPLLGQWGQDGETSAFAARIQVASRLSHHLYFPNFGIQRVAAFAVLLLVWTALFRLTAVVPTLRRLHHFAFASLLFSTAGIVLCAVADAGQGGSDQAFQLLRLYWFRLADIALPLATSLSLAFILADWWLQSRSVPHRALAGVAAAIFWVAFGLLVWDRHRDPRPIADRRSLPSYDSNWTRTWQTYQNWRGICDWIRLNTPTGAVFITPPEQQTFKWYAQRTEVFCWKDMPQDPASIVEWHRRAEQIYYPIRGWEAGLLAFDDQQLLELAEEFGADYLLVTQAQAQLRPTKLEQVYPEDPTRKTTYVLFRLRLAAKN